MGKQKSINSLTNEKAKDQTHLHFLVLALRIGFPGHVVEEVDAVRANQVDWTLALENQLIRYVPYRIRSKKDIKPRDQLGI